MKKVKLNVIAFIVGLSMSFTLQSCAKYDEKTGEESILNDGYFEYDGGSWSSIEYKIEEKTIDSCEYIIIFGSENRNIIHKANCRNSFHVRN